MNSWPVFAQYLTVKTANKFCISIITHIQDVYPESLSTKIPILGFLFNLIFHLYICHFKALSDKAL